MATPKVPKVERMSEERLAIRLDGNVQDVEITEEDQDEIESEEDQNEHVNSRSCSQADTLATLPRSLVPSQPHFGSVQVTESENVHFGDNIKGENIVFNFKGPVVIKQVVQPKEQDNPGYELTECETTSGNPRPQKLDTKKEDKIHASNMRLWLKLSFSAALFVAVAVTCALLSLTVVYPGKERGAAAAGDDQDPSADCVLVVEGFPTFGPLRLILILFLWSVLITLWCTDLLTKRLSKKKLKKTARTKPKKAKPRKRKTYKRPKAKPPLISADHLRIVPRTDWLAQPVDKPLDLLRLPVPWVIIQHTATESCHSQSECILSVRLIQMFHVESRGWFDIGYNFLVAGDGSAYVGRGWDYQGAHTLGYNRYSMGIAFIGTFNNAPPPKQQLDACRKLIQRGVKLGKIDKNYKLFAHRQLASTLSPGDKLFEILNTWPHFVQNKSDIDDLLPDY